MVEVRSSERGAALLTVLLLVAVMAVVTAGALERLTLATRLATNAAALDQARAYGYAAEVLAAGRIGDLMQAQGARTTLQGGWNGGRFTLPIPGGLGTARVADGGNCFNLNSVVAGSGADGLGNLAVRPLGVSQFAGLMTALGVDPGTARRIAAATADWIDADDAPLPEGAESEAYAGGPTPFRTANQPMIDPSELRVVAGVTPEIYAKLRPWLCALPVAQLSPINVNTLLPSQAPLLAMLIPGRLSLGQARDLLARRPANGYESSVQFWGQPALQDLPSGGEVGTQTVTRTRWFVVETDIELAGATAHETALYDAGAGPGAGAGPQQQPVRLVRRSWAVD